MNASFNEITLLKVFFKLSAGLNLVNLSGSYFAKAPFEKTINQLVVQLSDDNFIIQCTLLNLYIQEVHSMLKIF